MLFIGRYAKLGVVFGIILLSACVTHNRTQDMQMVRQNKYEKQARQLFTQGDYQQAAILFQRLADQPSVRQNAYRLQAVQTLLKLEEYGKAKQYLSLIVSAELNVKQRNQLHLLYANLYLSSGNAELAINRLNLISFSYLNGGQRRSYHESLAYAYALSGLPLKSAQQRIALEAYLDLALKHENSIEIFKQLSLVPTETLEKQLNRSQNANYSGWLELTMIATRFPKGAPKLNPALKVWSQQYQQHSGNALISSGYFVPTAIVLGEISEIAVLLPESGPYSLYAKAIKEGILAAYHRYEQDALQPDIQFYDSREAGIVSLYYQAVSQGAQLVIGPLNKKLVVELAENTDLSVPVLALNYIEGLVKENLYQFALSPVDEVEQVVRQAWSEDKKNAIILAPETAEGERIRNYFQNAWESLGGNILAVQAYGLETKDFSMPVKQMLNIKESKVRFQKLSNVIGNVNFYPRRRQDVDAIFLVAGNSAARLINPQFYHNRAKSVAIYGLSRIYAGHPKPKKDIDLEGVSFCSIPWLFTQAYQNDLDMQTLEYIWQALPDHYLSLIAFGIDAYTLIPYLNDMASIPYNGATGDLLLNEYNRIQRYLVCAKFKKGKARLLETSEEVIEGQEDTNIKPISAW